MTFYHSSIKLQQTIVFAFVNMFSIMLKTEYSGILYFYFFSKCLCEHISVEHDRRERYVVSLLASVTKSCHCQLKRKKNWSSDNI